MIINPGSNLEHRVVNSSTTLPLLSGAGFSTVPAPVRGHAPAGQDAGASSRTHPARARHTRSLQAGIQHSKLCDLLWALPSRSWSPWSDGLHCVSEHRILKACSAHLWDQPSWPEHHQESWYTMLSNSAPCETCFPNSASLLKPSFTCRWDSHQHR